MLVPVEMFSQGTCDNFFLPTFTFFLYRCQNLKTKFNLPPMFTKGTKCFSSFFLRHDYLIFVDSYFVLFVKMEGRSKFLFKILSPLTTVKNHAIVSDLFFLYMRWPSVSIIGSNPQYIKLNWNITRYFRIVVIKPNKIGN